MSCSNCKYWQKGKFAGKCLFSDKQPKAFLYPSFSHYTTADHTCAVYSEKEATPV